MQHAQTLASSSGIRAYLAFTGQIPNVSPAPVEYVIEVTATPTAKAKYQRRNSSNNVAQATVMWDGLNIGNGYRARLLLNGKVIDRKS